MKLQMIRSSAWLIACVLPLYLMGCRAAEPPMSKEMQIEQAMKIFWKQGRNDQRRLCTFIDKRLADQAGYQELIQQFLPGQWVVRYVMEANEQNKNSSRDFEIRQLDYLARVGLLEKIETSLNVGMIGGPRVSEYRATPKGWATDVFQGEKTSAPCFDYGAQDFFRVVNYTESEKDADGYRTLKINFLHGVTQFAEWAKDDEAALLFRPIKQSKEGQPGSSTLHRTPEGKLEISRGSKQFLEAVVQKTAPAPVGRPDESAVNLAIENTRTSPGPSANQTLPTPCFPLHSDTKLWPVGDRAAATALTFEAVPITGSALDVLMASYARLVQLSKAGLLTLKEFPRTSTIPATPRKFLVQPHPDIRDLLSEHGACLPLGDVRIEVVALSPVESQPNQTRVKAKYVVTNPAKWLSLIEDKELLPDLSAILKHGLPFEGTVLKINQEWRVAYISGHPPRYALPRLNAVGIATAWFSAANRRDTVFSSVADHDVHIINGRLPSQTGQSPQIPGLPSNTINIYVNPSTRPAIFILNAYDAIRWNFTLAPEAKVGSILALGYYEQTINGAPAKTTVVTVKRDFRSIDGSLTQMGTSDGNAPGLQRLGITPASVIETNGAKPVIINRQ